MKKLIFVLILSGAAWSQEQKVPFTLAVAPSGNDLKRGMSVELTHKFHYLGQAPTVQENYLVLTNVSDTPQPVFEFWNSWGTNCISIEITTADGKKSIAAYRGAFTVNYPSTFLILPGEHQIYPIRLDGWWAPQPELPKQESMPVTLKAIYNLQPANPDATKGTDEWNKTIRSVWVGRIESKEYNVTLLQREERKPVVIEPCGSASKKDSVKKQSAKQKKPMPHPCGA